MTIRKDQIKLNRTPRHVSCEMGAAGLEISPEPWDRYVKGGRLPLRAPGSPPNAPRWRWQGVDNRMSGKPVALTDPFVHPTDSPALSLARAREHTGKYEGAHPALACSVIAMTG